MLGPRDARSRRPSAIYQTVSERLSDKWGAAGTMAYASAHENISYRSFRRAVQPHRATPTCRQPAGTPQDPRSARDPKRRLLRPEERLSLAVATPRVSALEDRLPLVPSLAHQRDVGATQRRAARAPAGEVGQRTPQPSAGKLVDSQSVKTTGVGGNERGFDPAKKVEGRKRHLLVDTEGFVLEARVHNAKVPDQDGIRLLLKQVRERFPHLSHLWVDAGYQGRGRTWAEEVWGVSVEVVRKPPKPVPEEVAKAWAQECGPRKARRATGRGSCRSEASRCCLAGGWWSVPSPG